MIDGMTLVEVGEIFAYWAENPPVHLMLHAIARMLGWKPVEKTLRSFPEIAAMAPPGLTIAANGSLGMPPPVLDIEALRARNHARLANSGGRLASARKCGEAPEEDKCGGWRR